MSINLLIFAFLAGVLLESSPASAQRREPFVQVGHRVPVVIALADHFPAPDAPFVLLRRANSSPADVIVLPTSADAHLLSDAVRALLLARRHAGGDYPTSRAVLRARYRGGTMRAALPWASRVISDLQHAAPRQLDGVGRVRAVQIWLPRQR